VDGTISTDQGEISEYIGQFYNNMFFEQFSWRSNLDSLSFDSIGEVEHNWLERAFEKREFWEVVKAINSDKATGPNGYTMAFFQA
jgi:hypothetical protein